MEPQYGINVFEQVVQSRGMVLIVLLVLIGLSLFSWFIIAYKSMVFRRVRRETNEFLEAFWQSDTLDSVWKTSDGLRHCPVARVFRDRRRSNP